MTLEVLSYFMPLFNDQINCIYNITRPRKLYYKHIPPSTTSVPGRPTLSYMLVGAVRCRRWSNLANAVPMRGGSLAAE
jgi:hypothetical protein